MIYICKSFPVSLKKEVLFQACLSHVVTRLSLFWRIKPKHFLFSFECIFSKSVGVFSAHKTVKIHVAVDQWLPRLVAH